MMKQLNVFRCRDCPNIGLRNKGSAIRIDDLTNLYRSLTHWIIKSAKQIAMLRNCLEARDYV